jgi:hypothetical protein
MLMGVCEYAQHRNCSLRGVQHAVAAGRIQRLPNGLIDADKADRDWDLNTDEAYVLRVTGGKEQAARSAQREGDGPTFMASKARTQSVVADIKALELVKKRGDVLDRRQVETAAFNLYRQLRDACMAIPDRLCAQLATESNQETVRQLLEEELRSVFTQYANGAVE